MEVFSIKRSYLDNINRELVISDEILKFQNKDTKENPFTLFNKDEILEYRYGIRWIRFEITPTPTFSSNTAFIAVPSFTGTATENEAFWFHPDHLGSSNYITNFVGEVSQHMEYFAFGETFIEEHKDSHNSPYKFNGKELDEESGLYYYGARYYNPRTSIWLSVDPLAEKTMEPYAYANNNPIRFIDPDGRQGTDWFWDSKKKTFTYDASLTSAEQFNTLKGQGLVQGEYLGKNGNFNVVLGDETIGKVSLQSDGS